MIESSLYSLDKRRTFGCGGDSIDKVMVVKGNDRLELLFRSTPIYDVN